MNKISDKFFQKIKTHKIWAIIIAIGIIAVSYFSYSKIFPVVSASQYTFGRVRNGDLVVSVSGSGQVSTLSKVSIKPNTTGQTQTLGQIISVKVKNGDYVSAGQIVAILDGKNALQTLNQAKASVASAQASYNKLINGLTASDALSLNNTVTSAQISEDNAKENILISLKDAYTSTSNSIYLNTDSFFTNPTSVSPLITITGVNFTSQDLQNNVNIGRSSIEPILNNWREKIKTQKTSDDLVASLNSAISYLNVIRNYFDDMTMLFGVYGIASNSTGQTALTLNKSTSLTARASADSSISTLISVLQSYNNTILALKNAKDSLSVKQAPPSADDLAVSQANLDNAKANLANAETAYASRIITAPFDGQIGGLSADVGQQISSSDSLGTLITAQKVINVTLNEIDAAKIAAGNPVTISFDSLPGINLAGKVSYMDPLGTVVQGVVSYSVQISMGEQNDQIKTGMTATVNIITTQHSNTLIIPLSAITTTGGKKYVLVADTSSLGMQENISSTTRNLGTSTRKYFASSTFAFTSSTRASSSRQFGNYSASNTNSSSGSTTQYPVTQVEITTGISNNTNIEVLSGLYEGELIVTKKSTVSLSATKTSAASATTNTRAGGFSGFGGGAVGDIGTLRGN